MSKTTILKEHLEFKKTSVGVNKIKDIERYLKLFLNSSKKSFDKFEEKDIVKFLNSLEFKIRTINDIKAYIKSLIRWYYPDWSSKFRNLDRLLRRQTPPKTYTSDQMISYEEFEKIVKAETNLQWKVYWLILFYGGFRPGEACRLKWDEIFFESEGVVIKLRTTKTSKDFIKALPKEAEHKLKELKTNSTNEYVFPSPMTDSHIQTRSVCARLKRVSKKALGKEVVPYQLRHSIATILYGDKSKDNDDVAKQMGHSKNMKEVYENLNGEQIKKNARSLWGKKLTPEEKNKIEELEKRMEIYERTMKGIKSEIKVIFKSNDEQRESTDEQRRLIGLLKDNYLPPGI